MQHCDFIAQPLLTAMTVHLLTTWLFAFNRGGISSGDDRTLPDLRHHKAREYSPVTNGICCRHRRPSKVHSHSFHRRTFTEPRGKSMAMLSPRDAVQNKACRGVIDNAVGIGKRHYRTATLLARLCAKGWSVYGVSASWRVLLSLADNFIRRQAAGTPSRLADAAS